MCYNLTTYTLVFFYFIFKFRNFICVYILTYALSLGSLTFSSSFVSLPPFFTLFFKDLLKLPNHFEKKLFVYQIRFYYQLMLTDFHVRALLTTGPSALRTFDISFQKDSEQQPFFGIFSMMIDICCSLTSSLRNIYK